MNTEPTNRNLCLAPGKPPAGVEAKRAVMHLLVGNILAGVDELLREARTVRRTGSRDWAARLGEATAQLSLAELTTAGLQLRAALASLEFSSELLQFQQQQRREISALKPSTLPAAAHAN